VSSTALYQSPAQIRTRYGFDALPQTPEGQGSGQLIAIISTYNNPDIVENVATFSAKYNLPKCTEVKSVYTKPTNGYYTTNVSHPQVGQGCTIQVVNVDAFGTPTNQVYASNSSAWNAEVSMDAEWAHAMAPGASILIIQAPSPFVGALANAANYASNTAKADVVSMSWGAQEASITCPMKTGSTTIQMDPNCSNAATASKYWNQWNSMFTGSATFVAASGDVGKLQWPAIQNNVLAVGGTVENAKIDTGWSGSGGGLSTSYSATPAQKAVTGQTQRAVPDVAYDAGTAVAVYIKPNSATGYADATCVAANGAANCGWYGAGGTSAGAPQWAGITAVTNATRNAKRAPAINFLDTVYTVAAAPANYTTTFMDITSGNTAFNVSKVGYDLVTGLGIPNASALVSVLSN
jgi:subtilase family serine protease